MSKKSQRLEKENSTLKRQKDVTAANVIRMAEERQAWKKKMDRSEKKVDKLRLKLSAADTKTRKLVSIIQQMQQQGRKLPAGMESTLESYLQSEEDGPSEESDYSEEDDSDGEVGELDDHGHGGDIDGDAEGSQFDDGEAGGSDGEDSQFDDDTEEEPQPSQQAPRVPFGPERPPVAVSTATNGH